MKMEWVCSCRTVWSFSMNPYFQSLNNQHGGTVLIFVAVVAVFIGFLALALDVGKAFLTKQELQNVADAAALAGARNLGGIYETMSFEDQKDFIAGSDEKASISGKSQQIGIENTAGQVNLSIPENDIVLGRWSMATKTFTPTLVKPDALRVFTRREKGVNGDLSASFGKIFGINSMEVSSSGTAALTPIGLVPPGELEAPIGIATQWYANGGTCGDPITFHPTGNPMGCAAWHTFTDFPGTPAKISSILDDIDSDSFESPETTAGQSAFAFNGGMPPPLFAKMQNLYNKKKDSSGDWKVFLPIYQTSNCNPPAGMKTIVGFATAKITVVDALPSPLIQASVVCDVVETGRGGGTDYGTKGSIPKLVN